MTLYDILDIKRSALPEEIKKAYRQKCKLMHPDWTGADYQSFITALNLAKDTLLDPKRRRKYDRFLDERERRWLVEMAGEKARKGDKNLGPMLPDEGRVMVKKGKIPKLAPGERVVSPEAEFLEWDGK